MVIEHAGYQDSACRQQKVDRDLRLLLLDNDERPDDPFTLFNLGSLYQETDRAAEALPLLQRSLERSGHRDSIVPKLHVLIARCRRQLGQPSEALEACRQGRRHDPDNVEILFLEALPRARAGRSGGGGSDPPALLAAPAGSGFANEDEGLRGYKARHNLAVIYEETGRAAQAEAQWRSAVTENPSFTAGWLRLGELCLNQGRWADLEAALEGLAACPGGDAKSRALRERGLMARRERRRRGERRAAGHETSRLALHDRQGRRADARGLPLVGRRPRR